MVPCTCCRNMTLFGGNVTTMLIAAAVPPQKTSRTCGKRAKRWVAVCCCRGKGEVASDRPSAPRSLMKLSIMRLMWRANLLTEFRFRSGVPECWYAVPVDKSWSNILIWNDMFLLKCWRALSFIRCRSFVLMRQELLQRSLRISEKSTFLLYKNREAGAS